VQQERKTPWKEQPLGRALVDSMQEQQAQVLLPVFLLLTLPSPHLLL
jgi:hypothetical protein